MNYILITGGAGFIGCHLVDRLFGMGQKDLCIYNFDPFYDPEIKNKNIEHNLEDKSFVLVKEDIRNKKKLEEIFETFDIDKIIHLAARAGVRPSIKDPLLYEDVNINGTLNLLELCKEYLIKNFIFGSSSSSVYGINSKVPFSEDDPINAPISPYATSKKACELFCFIYSHLYNILVTCLRFFTVYGPRQRPEMAIHKLTRLIDQGKEVKMFGNGTSKRDYIYIDDIINRIISTLNKKFDFEIINLGNSEILELKYLISLIEKELGKKAKIKQLPDQPGDVPITYAYISKAKKLLDYHPKVKIEEGIHKFVEWYNDQKYR